MSSTISVALCTHNGEKYVEEQIRSILAQSRSVDEVVVSDDASTDGTLRIIEEAWERAGADAPVLRVLRNDVALGVTRNFERAIVATTGDLVSLCDQDDSWAPDRIRILARQFDERPALGLLFTDARLVDSEGQPMAATLFEALEISAGELAAVRGGEAADILFRRNLVTGATVMFRRELIDQVTPLDPTWVHDEWIAAIASVVSEVDWLPELLVDYRQHGSNQIGVTAPTLAYKIRRVFQPRGDRYTGLVTRTERLMQHLDGLGVPARISAALEEKLAHQKFRADLPSRRIARVASVLREARTGRYARYSSQGNLDVVRDLLQPDN